MVELPKSLQQHLDGLPPHLLATVAVAVVTFILLALFVRPGHDAKKRQLLAAKKACRELIDRENCGPILIRLAWHDSGSYDASKQGNFHTTGGANGSIRFDLEMKHGCNAGLPKGLTLLKPIKEQFPLVSWADLLQMASVTAIEMYGGPKINIRYGRKDAVSPDDCPDEGNLPQAAEPFADKTKTPAEHIKKVFYRMGFDDRDIVALSGAHTVGRAFKERSGTTTHGYTEKGATKYTCPAFRARADGKQGVGMAGGQSWTKQWLKFDNSYFTEPKEADLLRLETDKCLETDPAFAKYYKQYAESQDKFFEDYADAHKRLSELGSIFEPKGGIYL